MKKVLAILLLCMISLYGCGKDTQAISQDDVAENVSRIFGQDFSQCTESLLQLQYKNMTNREKALSTAYLSACHVETVTVNDSTAVVTIIAPDMEQLYQIATGDNGFVQDYLSLVTKGVKKKEIRKKIMDYYISQLSYSDLPTVEQSISLPVNEDGTIVSDAEIASLLQNVLSHDWLKDFKGLKNSNHKSENSSDESVAELKKISADSSFIYSENDARFLVHDIKIVEGMEALDCIHSLNESNASATVATDNYAIYITFKVRNLSNKSAVAENHFCLVDADGQILQNEGMLIVGLQDAIKIEANKEAELSCFLIGPQNSSLVWYSKDALGCYEISVH